MFNKFINLDQLLSSSWFLKTVSLIVALVLWIYVSGDRNAEMTRTLTCPVHFVGLATQTSLKTDVEEVEVQLSGERSIITGLEVDKVACEINLSGLEPGKYRLAVRTTVPRDLKLVNVTPSHLDIELVRVIEKIFPVIIEVKGGLPSGLFLDRVDIEPQN
ncbi:MAG TPA: CdaR family protein, partial [Synergistales bacterium]|nr:CdaR family protein [Synergistales bacterium]